MTLKTTRTLIMLILWIGLHQVYGQDPVFSQFYAAPLQVNPAFVGTSLAPRFTANYRNQYPSWPNAYSTYALSYEQPIEPLNSALGLMVMGDEAGDGIYSSTRVHGVYGYNVMINRDYSIRFGVQAGVIQTTLDWDKLIFGDVLDPLDGAIGTSEEIPPASLNKRVFDVSAGLLLYSKKAYLGMSAIHLNSPDESLLGINEYLSAGLPMRLTFHGGWNFNVSGRNNIKEATFISPSLMYIHQGSFNQINGGAFVNFGSFFGGTWYRHTFSNADAVVVLAGVRYEAFRIGYSFDMTVSGLKATPGGTGGTHEISLSYSLEDTKFYKNKRNSNKYSDCFKMFQ